MYSHSTEHTAQMTCVQWLKDVLRAEKDVPSSTRHGSSFAARDTEHFLTVSLFCISCVVVVFFSEPRPVVHVSNYPLRRSTAGWHFYGIPFLPNNHTHQPHTKTNHAHRTIRHTPHHHTLTDTTHTNHTHHTPHTNHTTHTPKPHKPNTHKPLIKVTIVITVFFKQMTVVTCVFCKDSYNLIIIIIMSFLLCF